MDLVGKCADVSSKILSNPPSFRQGKCADVTSMVISFEIKVINDINVINPCFVIAMQIRGITASTNIILRVRILLLNLQSLVVRERCNTNCTNKIRRKIILSKWYFLTFLSQLSHILAFFTTCLWALIVLNVGQDGSSEVKQNQVGTSGMAGEVG